jgi:hypothetical protein
MQHQLTSWITLIGPAGMPADLVGQVNAPCVKALADPGPKTRYNDLGAASMPRSQRFAPARRLPIMKAAGIKPE